MNYISSTDNKTLLRIYVQPGASKNEIVGLYGEPPRLKIKITAPPEDGKANLEVVSFLAKTLGISKTSVELIRGQQSRQKDLVIDMQEEDVRKYLSVK